MSSKRSSGSQEFSSVSRSQSGQRCPGGVCEAGPGLETKSKGMWDRFGDRYKQSQHILVLFMLHLRGKWFLWDLITHWGGRASRWNSVYKCHSFGCSVRRFLNALRMTISPTISTWRARKNRTDPEIMLRETMFPISALSPRHDSSKDSSALVPGKVMYPVFPPKNHGISNNFWSL